MNNFRFPIASVILGVGIAFTQALNSIHHLQEKRLNNAKIDITDSINQQIGYQRCRLEELEREKSQYKTWNILKRFAAKSSVKEIDEKISEVESKIRELEQQIADIRSSNTMRMLHYVEEKMESHKKAKIVKLIPVRQKNSDAKRRII